MELDIYIYIHITIYIYIYTHTYMLPSLCKDDTTMQQETMEGCIKIKTKGLPTEGIGTRQMSDKNWGKSCHCGLFYTLSFETAY